MARHCIREPRYIPPVHAIGEHYREVMADLVEKWRET